MMELFLEILNMSISTGQLMMEELFLNILDMSVAAGWLILAVVLLRAVFRRAPKWFICLLWALVAFRLLCPFSVESRFSLLPDLKIANRIVNSGSAYIMENNAQGDLNSGYAEDYVEGYGDEYAEGYGEGYIGSGLIGENNGSEENARFAARKHIIDMAMSVWLCGFFAFLIYAVVSFYAIKKKTAESVRLRDNIYACDGVDMPFILGIVRPRIFMPSDIDAAYSDIVLTHEKAHIDRRDYIWKALGYLILAIYWFNPLCILAYVLFCRDMEMACDEKVVRSMDAEAKKTYSAALLSYSVRGKLIPRCPLAFGEVGVKARIKGILNYKKPTFWVITAAMLTCAVAVVCFLTNPVNDTFIIGIKIPANCEPGMYYSNEEISPNNDAIYCSVGQDVGDSQVQLLPIECSEENAYDELIYVTPGMTAKVNAEKDAWFKLGVYAGNDSDKDKTIYVTVRNVGVVRVTATAEAEPIEESIEVKAPVLNPDMPTGADGSTIYYADSEKFIFGGYYGLFVYDMVNEEIARSLDLEPIGCNYTQGEAACEISVTADGMTVFLHPMNMEEMYVYNVADNTLTTAPYDIDNATLYHNQYDGNDYASYEADGEIKYLALVNDTTIGELGYLKEMLLSNYVLIFPPN